MGTKVSLKHVEHQLRELHKLADQIDWTDATGSRRSGPELLVRSLILVEKQFLNTIRQQKSRAARQTREASGCKICQHRKRDDIERDLPVLDDAALARKYGVQRQHIVRHRRDHRIA